MNKLPETPIFARRTSLKRGSEQAEYRNFSFAEICGSSPNESLDFLNKAKISTQKLRLPNSAVNEKKEIIMDGVLKELNSFKGFSSEYARRQFEFKIKKIIDNSFEVIGKDNDKEEEKEEREYQEIKEQDACDEVIKILAQDIEKVCQWRLLYCQNLGQFSEVLCNHIKTITEDNKKLKDSVKNFMSKLVEVRESIKKLLENFKVTEFPEAPKLMESEHLPIRRKLSDVKIDTKMEILPDNLESLKIELQILENKLKSKSCKPNEVISRILAIKNKISEIRTKKTINRNRELSQKVRRGLDSIEKAWVLTERKPSTPSLKDSQEYFYETINSEKSDKIRSISPIFSKTINTSGFLSEISDDQKQMSLSIRSVKQKEEALDYLDMTRKNKEAQLDSLISEYKTKLLDLEQEHEYFLKIKAKTFSEAKKLKEVESLLRTQENRVTTARDKVNEDDEEHWVDLKMKEKSLAEVQAKLNSEIKKVHREKEKICKAKSVIDYRLNAVNQVWPFIKSALKEFKSLKLS